MEAHSSRETARNTVDRTFTSRVDAPRLREACARDRTDPGQVRDRRAFSHDGLGSTSSRRPLNQGARRVPVRVHSVIATPRRPPARRSQSLSAAGGPERRGVAREGLQRARSRPSAFRRSRCRPCRRSCSPLFSSWTPTAEGAEPLAPAALASVQPPMTTSSRLDAFTFTHDARRRRAGRAVQPLRHHALQALCAGGLEQRGAVALAVCRRAPGRALELQAPAARGGRGRAGPASNARRARGGRRSRRRPGRRPARRRTAASEARCIRRWSARSSACPSSSKATTSPSSDHPRAPGLGRARAAPDTGR